MFYGMFERARERERERDAFCIPNFVIHPHNKCQQSSCDSFLASLLHGPRVIIILDCFDFHSRNAKGSNTANEVARSSTGSGSLAFTTFSSCKNFLRSATRFDKAVCQRRSTCARVPDDAKGTSWRSTYAWCMVHCMSSFKETVTKIGPMHLLSAWCIRIHQGSAEIRSAQAMEALSGCVNQWNLLVASLLQGKASNPRFKPQANSKGCHMSHLSFFRFLLALLQTRNASSLSFGSPTWNSKLLLAKLLNTTQHPSTFQCKP